MSIDLNLTSEQRQILDAMRKALAEQFPLSRLRGGQSVGSDTTRLPLLADLGAFGLGAGDEVGGAGFSCVEETLLFAELGRHLVTPHALTTTLGARLASALGWVDLARDFVAGRKTVCVANALQPFAIDRLEGLPVHLIDPQGTSHALIWNDSGIALLRGDGLQGQRIASMDRSVNLQRAVLSQTMVLGHLASGATSLVRQAHLLLSAMLLGMAEATRDMAVDYAKVRVQFGQPIGAFQAVKHRCANMAIGAEALRAQIVFAAIAERDGWPDAAFQNDACRMLAARCALANAAANIQVHGGMGFSAECDAHLFLLRAHLYEHLGGTRELVRARLTTPQPSEPAPQVLRPAMEVL